MAGKVRVSVISPFYDESEGVLRQLGDEFDVDAARLSEINGCGPRQNFRPLVVEVRRAKGGRPTKAELTARAEGMGIDVPDGATNPEIHAMIEKGTA